MKLIYILIILSLFYLVSNTKYEENFTEFLDWCVANDVYISPKLEYSFDKTKSKTIIILNENIDKDTELIYIPNNLRYNIQKILNSLNSKELSNQYNKFLELDISSNNLNKSSTQKEQIFLSYILYAINHESNLYDKSEFYNKFKIYLSIIQINIPVVQFIPKTDLFNIMYF